MRRRMATLSFLASSCCHGTVASPGRHDDRFHDTDSHRTRLPRDRRELFAPDDAKYLTTCITPYPGYVADGRNDWRVPMGDIKVIFDGGNGEFNATTHGEYPGYNDQLEFTFHYELMGLPDHCNGCRIQINEGQSCGEALTRFWNRSIEDGYNPWRPEYGAVYHSDRNGMASGQFSMFDGYDFDDHKRRTAVVFDRDHRVRIGCGVLRRKDLGRCSGGDPLPPPSRAPMPSNAPVSMPSKLPSTMPSTAPSMIPSPIPSTVPSPIPSTVPSTMPSMKGQPRPPTTPSIMPARPSRSEVPTVSPHGSETPAPMQTPHQPTKPSAPTQPDIPTVTGSPHGGGTASPFQPHPYPPTPPDVPTGKKGKGGSSSSKSSSSDGINGKKTARRK